MSLDYWYMFPVSILIATTAMASGVEGGTFFAPLFLLALRLPPEVAIGGSLITEVFGFASGLFAYVRKRLIDYRLGLALLLVSLPLALLGTWAGGWIEPLWLKAILGLGLLVVAISFLRAPKPRKVSEMDEAIQQEYGGAQAHTVLLTAEGEEIRYTVCNRTGGRFFAGVGGLFMGLIATGLGELNGYFLLRRCRVPSKVAVGTSVFVVAITALVASSGYFIRFAQTGGTVLQTVLNLVVFTVSGVIVGGQLGALLADRVSQRALERGLAALFIGIALLLLGEVVL